jgi:hypothetical protein
MNNYLKTFCIVAFAVVFMVSVGYGQTAAFAQWKLIVPDSLNVSGWIGGINPQPAAGTDSFKVISYSGTVGGGPGPLGLNFCRWNPGSGLNWGPETAENPYHYVQFVVVPVGGPGATFTVDSVTFYSAGGGTGNMRAFAYYSKDAFATRTRLTPSTSTNGDTLVLPNSSTAFASYLFPVNASVSSPQNFTLRLYPWYTGAASTSKYFYTQYVIIKGTTKGGTGVSQSGEVPNKFELEQNYPNPFNPSTQISYNVPRESFVSLKVFNLMGQEVATLVSGNQTAGKYTVPFDASHVSSGIYMYRLQAGSSVEVKRMTFVK